MFYEVSAKYDVFGAAVFAPFVKDNIVFEGFALQTPSVAVFAKDQAPKSQTALGNRWPGASTSSPDLKTMVFTALYEVWPLLQLRNLVFYEIRAITDCKSVMFLRARKSVEHVAFYLSL